MSSNIFARWIEPVVEQRMSEEAVLLIEGPRSVGKSTLLAGIAARHGVEVIDLDSEDTAQFARTDPRVTVSGPRPVCIDEYQYAPQVLGEIKAQLNKKTTPGSFVLTGSARHASLPTVAQALTGRLHRIAIYPLTQAELSSTSHDFLEVAWANPKELTSPLPSKTLRDDYLNRIAVGGFPLAVRRSTQQQRNRWFDDYLALTLERDVASLSKLRQAALLPDLLARLAGQSAQLLNVNTIAQQLEIERATAQQWIRLLEAVFAVYLLPAWGTTLSQRAVRSPKVHCVDSGIATRLLRLDPTKLARRTPSALAEFGHLLETFVVGELQRLASWREEGISLGHWRLKGGVDEVDVVLERDDGAVMGVEVTAASRVPGTKFSSMAKLRDLAGSSWHCGIVLYLGERSYCFDETQQFYVMPVDKLWVP